MPNYRFQTTNMYGNDGAARPGVFADSLDAARIAAVGWARQVRRKASRESQDMQWPLKIYAEDTAVEHAAGALVLQIEDVGAEP